MTNDFNAIWTSRYVRSLLKKMEARPRIKFLCFLDDKFNQLWNTHRQSLLNLAQQWLYNNQHPGVSTYQWVSNSGPLFVVNRHLSRRFGHRGIRILFLKHELARLSVLERINKKNEERARFRKVWNKKNVADIIRSMTFANESYLCYGSHLFRSIWQKHKTKLFKLAKNFLKENPHIRFWSSNQMKKPTLLFYNAPMSNSALSNRDIRMYFLRYELKRLSKKRV